MLTSAELEVLEVLRQNPIASVSGIADTLGKRPKTIENQLGSIFKKLEISGDTGESKIRRLMFELYWFRPLGDRNLPDIIP